LLLAMAVWTCAREAPPPRPAQYPKPYRVFGKWYQPIPDAKGFRQEGIASWYGRDFHGRKTSSGEIYDMHAMTAAHKTLPLGTYVRVRNLSTNREVEVRVNDRGPFVRGRIIDLSYAAAKQMEMVGPGTAPVEVVALGVPVPEGGKPAPEEGYPPVDLYTGNFTVQVGAFSQRTNAERLRALLGRTFEPVFITPFDSGSGIFYRVRVGKYTDLKKAEENETLLINRGFSDAFAVAE